MTYKSPNFLVTSQTVLLGNLPVVERQSRRQVYGHRHAVSRQRESQEQKNIEMPPEKTLKFGKSADARRKHVARTEAKQKTS